MTEPLSHAESSACWRVWFRNRAGDERYFDVPGPFGSMAVAQAHAQFRAEPGSNPMYGWWVDRWQLLVVPVGRWTGRWPRCKLVIERPPLRRRIRVFLRRARAGT